MNEPKPAALPAESKKRAFDRWVFLVIGLALIVVGAGFYWWRYTQIAAFRALPTAAQAEGLSEEARAYMDEWTQPEQGKLAGTVVGHDDFGVVIEDFNGKHWYALSLPGETPGREIYALFASKVRVVGEYAGGMNFKAKEFLPWVAP